MPNSTTQTITHLMATIFFWTSIATVPLRTKTPTQHHKTAATMTKQNKNTEIKQGGEERRIKHEKIESL